MTRVLAHRDYNMFGQDITSAPECPIRRSRCRCDMSVCKNFHGYTDTIPSYYIEVLCSAPTTKGKK